MARKYTAEQIKRLEEVKQFDIKLRKTFVCPEDYSKEHLSILKKVIENYPYCGYLDDFKSKNLSIEQLQEMYLALEHRVYDKIADRITRIQVAPPEKIKEYREAAEAVERDVKSTPKKCRPEDFVQYRIQSLNDCLEDEYLSDDQREELHQIYTSATNMDTNILNEYVANALYSVNQLRLIGLSIAAGIKDIRPFAKPDTDYPGTGYKEMFDNMVRQYIKENYNKELPKR